MIIKNGKRYDGGMSDTVPIGTLNPFLGTTAPFGYLLCQGQLVSKTIYPELYAICGDNFGQSTQTHFYLPDLRGQTIVGYKEGDATFGTLGGLIGSASITYTPQGSNSGGAVQSHTLTTDEIPSHTHAWDGVNGAAGTAQQMGNYPIRIFEDIKTNWNGSPGNIKNTGGGQGHSHGFTQPTFSGTQATLDNIQPSLIMNWVVKATTLFPVQATVVNSHNASSVNVYSTNYINDSFQTKVSIQNNAPLTPQSNDLWIDTDDENKLKFYINSTWNDVSGSKIKELDIDWTYSNTAGAVYFENMPSGIYQAPEEFTKSKVYLRYYNLYTSTTDTFTYSRFELRPLDTIIIYNPDYDPQASTQWISVTSSFLVLRGGSLFGYVLSTSYDTPATFEPGDPYTTTFVWDSTIKDYIEYINNQTTRITSITKTVSIFTIDYTFTYKDINDNNTQKTLAIPKGSILLGYPSDVILGSHLSITLMLSTGERYTISDLDVSQACILTEIKSGANIPIQSTAPLNPQDGDLWIDTSEDMSEPLDIYSTSETKTNKIWIDGKPIYRKIIITDSTVLSTLHGKNQEIPHNISNLSEVTFYTGRFTKGSTPQYWVFGDKSQTSPYTNIRYVDSTNIVIDMPSGDTWDTSTLYVTLEYTKTTD